MSSTLSNSKPHRSLSARELAQETLLRARDEPGFVDRTMDTLSTTARLYRAWFNKEYSVAPWKSILLAIVAFAYTIIPTDLIPDFILVVGFLDDMALLGFLWASINADAQKFKIWEAQKTLQEPINITPDAPQSAESI